MQKKEKTIIKEEPLTKSDWIQFLIFEQNKILVLITGGIIAILIFLMVLFTWYIDKQNYLGAVLTVIVGIIIVFIVNNTLNNQTSKLNRARKLVEQIMKGEKTDLNEIKEIWFGKKIMYEEMEPSIQTQQLNRIEEKINQISASGWLFGGLALDALSFYFLLEVYKNEVYSFNWCFSLFMVIIGLIIMIGGFINWTKILWDKLQKK